jgi:RND family efflux transporter MFP subunit
MLALGIFATGVSCNSAAGAALASPRAPSPPNVMAVKVRRTSAEVVLDLPAEVTAFRRALLHARIAGYVDRILVELGTKVHRGQALAVIASPELEADVGARRADLEERQRRAQRILRLEASGIASEQDMERARADAAMSSGELARVASLKGYAIIRAPFDGVITARLADEGTLTAPNPGDAGALFEISALDTVRVRAQIPDAHAHAVKAPLPLEIRDGAEAPLRAAVDRVSSRLDLATRSMVAEATVQNFGWRFFPGQYVRVTLRLPGPSRLTIPPEALMMRDGKMAVAVLRDGRAKVVTVAAGEHHGSSVDILSGLGDGDVVILHAGDVVQDGGLVVASVR